MIDLGKVTMPTKWEDVTLKQFQQILAIYDKEDKDILDIVSLFSGKDKKALRLFPKEFIDEMICHLQFMETKLEVEPSNKLDEYSINYLEKLKFGEFTDVETFIKDDKYNYAAMLAVLARKEGEIYDDDFIANKLDDRIKMFEEMPITKALVLLNFFLKLGQRYIIYSQKFLETSKEQVGQCLQSIKNSLKAGGGLKLNSIYARIKLRNLEKQLKCI